MPPINRPADAETRIANLERAIAELRSGTITSRDGSVVLPAGTSLTVTDPEGQVLAYIGSLGNTRPDGQPHQGTILRRDDGSVALSVQGETGSDPKFWNQFVALWDRSGSIIISDDTISGAGLARPYLPISLAPNYEGMPSVAGATWQDIEVGTFYKQHPKALVTVNFTTSNAETTGQVRVVLDDVVVAGPVDVAFAITRRNFGPVDLPGAPYSQHTLRVQGIRTAGTGTVRAASYALGVQS